ncbi:MAG: tetratricopeptide repeat protein [Candidatus Dadabacteria bacterium]|nr:tetratricopeptide repeat protein [Candidatus Dadabacteria bacterium]
MNWIKKPSNILFVCLLGFAFLFTLIASFLDKPNQIPDDGISTGISIINVVATMMGVLIGLIVLLIAVAAFFGIERFKRFEEKMEEFEKRSEEIKKRSEDIEVIHDEVKKHGEAIEYMHKKAEQDLKERGEGIGTVSLTEEPTKEVQQKLDEFGRRLEFGEFIGAPLTADNYITYGIDLYYKGEHEQALKAFEKALRINPDFADALNNRGSALRQLKRYEEALKAYEKAIEINPDYAEAWSNKAAALLNLKRPDEALLHSDKAVELDPKSAGAWYNRACAYSLKGEKENALPDLAKSIELDEYFKERAKEDDDFKDLWDDPEFKKLVE